jgi:hypothetical protein
MKMRLTMPDARTRWLVAGRSAAGALLLAVTVSGCIGSGSPTVFTPSPQTSAPSGTPGTRTPSPTGQGPSSKVSSRSSGTASGGTTTSARASASASGTPSASPTSSSSRTSAASHPATPQPTHTAATHQASTHTAIPSTRPFPTTAPETGGGGTAGLQDGVVFGAGGAAILAGLGALAYRRRLRRRLAAGRPAVDDQQDREPAGR